MEEERERDQRATMTSDMIPVSLHIMAARLQPETRHTEEESSWALRERKNISVALCLACLPL